MSTSDEKCGDLEGESVFKFQTQNNFETKTETETETEKLTSSSIPEVEESFMRISVNDRAGKGKYSTTSSVYAEHTITNPAYDQVLFCISSILQAQIFEDEDASEELKRKYSEFDLDIILPPEMGGVVDEVLESILNHETLNDSELREKILRGVVPTVDTIFRFINLLYQRAKYSSECNIISLIYVNRLTSSGRMPLTMSNWRGIWLSAINLAQKVWDDNPLKTSQFIRILPSVTKEQLRNLERKALALIEFVTGVKPSLYAKYYFELRQLFAEITGGDTTKFEWKMKPMTIVEQKSLEDRSQRCVFQYREVRGGNSNLSTPFSVVSAASNMNGKTPQSPAPFNYATYEDVTRTDTTRYVIS